MSGIRHWAFACVALLSGAAFMQTKPAAAQSPADFYKGKTIHIIVGYPPGGSYDFYARLGADMLKAHVPGVSSVIVENKPGAGGFVASAYVYNQAPKDGTYLAVLPELLGQAQLEEPSVAKWKMQDFNMIGSFSSANSVFMLRKGAPAQNIDQMKSKQVVVGCTGTTAQSYQYAIMLKSLAGLKFKMVCGYRGARSYTLALTRGEIDMVSSAWNSWRVTNMREIKNGKFIPLIQVGLKRVKELPNVPLMQDLVSDPEAKKLFEFASSAAPIGRALFAPPGVPQDRVEYLRKVFDQMTSDPAMVSLAEKRRLLLDPTPGAEVQKEVDTIVQTPSSIVKKVTGYFQQ